MSRLTRRSTACAARRRGGLVAYVTAGDPDLERSAEILVAVAQAGADVLEVGIPFSDPLADGPVIQRASERALAGGMTLRGALEIDRARADAGRRADRALHLRQSRPAHGRQAFVRTAADAGVDGVLVLDLPVEEAGPFRSAAGRCRPRSDLPPQPDDDATRGSAASAELGADFSTSSRGWGSPACAISWPRTRRRWSRASGRCADLPLALGFGISHPSRWRRWGRGRTRRWSAARWSTSSRNTAPRLTWRARRRVRALAEGQRRRQPRRICASRSTCSTSRW